MTPLSPSDLFLGLFHIEDGPEGIRKVRRSLSAPPVVTDPSSGRPLKVATMDDGTPSICPSCAERGHGGFVSFESDLRAAYACPSCRQLVWLAGV